MNTNPGIYGRKLGMTQLFTEDGTVVRVTVIEAGPLTVVGKRTKEPVTGKVTKGGRPRKADGYSALIVGFDERKEKHTNKPLAGFFAEAKVTPKRVVREIRADEEFVNKYEVGQTMKLDELFKPGQYIDAQGVTRGRGFTGVMRRWSFAGGVGSHGTHEYFRHGGSIGTNMTPGRTLPNLRMPGQYGNETVSVQNLKVARVDADKHLLLIEGGVPGAKNGILFIRHAVKKVEGGGRKRKS
jgi:large subunit ribosomal protein L3